MQVLTGVCGAVTLMIGWMVASRRAWGQGRILAIGGGLVWGGIGAISVLAHPGAGDLPWGLIVIANLAVGLVVVSAAVAFGAGARLAFDRVLAGRN